MDIKKEKDIDAMHMSSFNKLSIVGCSFCLTLLVIEFFQSKNSKKLDPSSSLDSLNSIKNIDRTRHTFQTYFNNNILIFNSEGYDLKSSIDRLKLKTNLLYLKNKLLSEGRDMVVELVTSSERLERAGDVQTLLEICDKNGIICIVP